MWEIYQREGRGLAITTTWADLTTSLATERKILGGRVNYVDYTSTFIPEGDSLSPFMHKRKSFLHEQEVRLIAKTGIGGDVYRGASGGEDAREGSGQWVLTRSVKEEPAVIAVPVDLQRLIRSVYVAPKALDWFGDLIEKIVRRYGLDVNVVRSDLYTDPSKLV
ncbi:hypothetical protein SAMN02799638_01806 [Arthrobacter sp. UNCCL28]|nr:hypothetical protein SAMN02799638_01806 [Arthrobacter sp. UNCCL28]